MLYKHNKAKTHCTHALSPLVHAEINEHMGFTHKI